MSWLDKHESIKKYHYFKCVHVVKKNPKVRKHTIFTYYGYFPYFALLIETTWAKTLVKPILKIEISMFGLFILGYKNQKTYNVKQNNSKCTKFIIKNWNKTDQIWDYTYNLVVS